MMGEDGRDVEKVYAKNEFVAKLRRLADAIEAGESFTIQVAGKRFTVPAGAEISIEHEQGEDQEELEFQLVWPRST
jgi:amphi-Trp domain-containing protein